MAKITYTDKNTGDNFSANEANEIKEVVNNNDDNHLGYLDISLPFRNIYVAIGRQLNIWKAHLNANSLSDKDVPLVMITTNNADTTNNCNKEDSYTIEPDTEASETLNYAWYGKNLQTLKTLAYSNALKIVADNAGTGAKRLLFIGDSLMAAQTIVTETNALITSGGGITATLLGTQGSTGNKHEGYSGKTWSWFNSSDSPFYNSGTSEIDFSNYMSTNGFTGDIDIAIFQLGINDVIQTAISNYPLDSTELEDIMTDCLNVINKLLSDYPDCKIIFNMEPIGGTQDGAVYSAYHLKRKMLQLFEAYYTEFSQAKWSGKVYINPAYLWVDPIYGYPIETADRSARETSIQTIKQTDCIHCSQSGYKQIADATYSAIRYILSL